MANNVPDRGADVRRKVYVTHLEDAKQGKLGIVIPHDDFSRDPTDADRQSGWVDDGGVMEKSLLFPLVATKRLNRLRKINADARLTARGETPPKTYTLKELVQHHRDSADENPPK